LGTKTNNLGNWNPTESIANHDGTPIDSKYLFIVSPPVEIGELLSASSTFSKHHPISLFKLLVKYFSKFKIFIIFSFVISGIIVFISMILQFNEENKSMDSFMDIAAIIVLPGLLNGLLYFLYVKLLLRKIYYIGKNGIAIYSFTFPFNKDLLKCRTFLYKNIKSIRIDRIRHYDQQLSTRYKYTKNYAEITGNEENRCLFQDWLKKSYDENGKIPSNHPINFYSKANELLYMRRAKNEDVK